MTENSDYGEYNGTRVVSGYPVIYAYTDVKNNRKNQGDMHNDFGEYTSEHEIND